jgi:hypothetical protein
MVQLMPLGVEITVPLPPAPPETATVNAVDEGTNVGPTVVSLFTATWQVRLSSTFGVQPFHS